MTSYKKMKKNWLNPSISGFSTNCMKISGNILHRIFPIPKNNYKKAYFRNYSGQFVWLYGVLSGSAPAAPTQNSIEPFYFIDDQGYNADLYFADADENTFNVVLKKLANA